MTFKQFINCEERHLIFMALFPITVIYYEIVFNLATVRELLHLSVIPMLLFSAFIGMVVYLLLSISKNITVNRILTGVMLFLLAVPYLIEFLVFYQFKIFYDVNTVTGGAGDALGSFMKDIFQMVFSLKGIIVFVLMLLPTLLYCILGRWFVYTSPSDKRKRLITAGTMFISYGLALIMVFSVSATRSIYTDEYNFQTAVTRLGLLTGMRLDIQNSIKGNNDGFEDAVVPVIPTAIPTNTPESGPEATVEVPIEYGYNIMELDTSGAGYEELNQYVLSQTASKQNKYTGIFKGKNMIMITAEAFTAEVIDPVLTPTLYRLATKGINFTDYYQPASAGTTGGEYQNIFGMLPMAGGKAFKNTAETLNYFTIGSQLDRLGYYGKAYHNNSYTYYDRNITHNNLGYSDGFMGKGNGMEQYVSNKWPQSDLEMISGTLPTYIDKQPFNIYYMTVSGHSGYTRTGNSMTNKNWDKVKDLSYSDTVKGYLAANMELESAMAHLVSELEKAGIADNTVICISSDHFPYGLDSDGKLGSMPYLSELYGYQVNDYFQRDHSRLILWCGELEKSEPIIVDTPTSSLDILPTLSNLFGTEFDSRLFPGRDVFSDAEPLVFNTNYDWKTAYGTYYASTGTLVPKDENVTLPENYVSVIKTVVRNKIRYCKQCPENDYFRYLFG